ncbi:hypothetical protein SNR37_000174 [Agarivorans aestuarii]|uniref:Uncharacterized protein n=1 Tax=Agarivorans aestuarii TaxID=1563703 RepID=A0ABU7G6F1_9ALTE|nr:hypothetical protein [Agarivorans aestuarii]MEE1674855.1 hypothetical protein [Agarivorans aestuarii]
MIEFKGNNTLVVKGKDEYKLSRIHSVSAKPLSIKDQCLHFMSCALSFSTIGWIGAYSAPVLAAYFASFLFGLGLLWALFTFRRYELRAGFKAVDETGDFEVPICRCIKQRDFSRLKQAADDISQRLNSPSSKPYKPL